MRTSRNISSLGTCISVKKYVWILQLYKSFSEWNIRYFLFSDFLIAQFFFTIQLQWNVENVQDSHILLYFCTRDYFSFQIHGYESYDPQFMSKIYSLNEMGIVNFIL